MARRQIDVFGFDELEKAFKLMEKKWPNEADALLMARGKQAQKRVKQLSPVYKGPAKKGIKPKQLRNSWSLLPVKLYKGGTVRVVRLQSKAPHVHLIEYGHDIYRGGKTRERGRKLNGVELSARGITHHGRAKAFKMMETSMKEQRDRFTNDAEKLLNQITSDVEV